jgi:hypothetical protein
MYRTVDSPFACHAVPCHHMPCQVELDRDSSLLQLKIKALWALGRIAPLLGGKGPRADGGDEVGIGSKGVAGGKTGAGWGSGGRESETEEIAHLIETSRLRLGDLRGELESRLKSIYCHLSLCPFPCLVFP